MFFEDIKIAFKQLKFNKSRSIYNLFLSFILGTISLLIITMNISIRITGDRLANERYYMDYSIPLNVDTGFVSRAEEKIIYMDKSEVNGVLNYTRENSKFINEYYFVALIGEKPTIIQFFDVDFLVKANRIKLKNNNLPSKERYVYVSEKYAASSNLNIGDSIKQNIVINNEPETINFIIADIYEGPYGNILYDIELVNDNNPLLNNFDISVIGFSINKDNDINETLSFNKDLKDNLSKLNNGNVKVTCIRYDEYTRIKMMTNIFFYATLIFVIIIILLTTSIISHSSVIMLDLNKNTFGLFKALGMKNKDVSIILLIELLVSFIIGLLASIILYYSLTSVINIYLNKMFKALYNFIEIEYLNEFNVTLSNGFFIPLIFILFLITVLLLLSYRGLKIILNKSTITLIKKKD